MQPIIVADTSCLIVLEKINQLSILKHLFGVVTITSAINSEYGLPLPEFIKLQDPLNKKYQQILETILDKGEASAIALAIEQENALLIIDDLKGRHEASQLGIKITGTIGLLVLAKKKGHIVSLKKVFADIANTNFRINPKLIAQILEIFPNE
jgi:predicted nucleic acid-binding protein